jgi:ethanolaminephosphotransferase
MWMAPNMVTLLGFMWIVANIFIIEIFVEDMVGPVSVHGSFLLSDVAS